MVFRNERTWQNAVEAGTTEEFHRKFDAAIEKVRSEFGATFPLIIGGEEVRGRKTFPDTSPGNRKLLLGRFQRGTKAHVKKAVAAARGAFPGWSQTRWLDRMRIFYRAADRVSERKFALAALMTFENGKTRLEAMADVDEAADLMRWYAEEMGLNHGYENDMGQFFPGERARSVLKPYGVWAVVAPFNFPLAIAGGMSSGALITGNTVVFKPASDTPYIGFLLYELLRDAGVPPGAFNYVTGPGSTVGRALVDDPGIDGFVFTGSRNVGLEAHRTRNASFPKPTIMELGGKNPTIVTESADLDRAAVGVMRGAFGYGGQKCSATSRVLVDKRIKTTFVEKLVAETAKIKIGDPSARDTYLGPLINEAAIERYTKALALVKRSHGTIVFGGKVLPGDGLFVEPTIVDGLRRDHRINKEELFVPFVSLIDVDGIDDAIQVANDVDYGLTAGIFSDRQKEIDRFSREVEAGVLYANRAAGSTTGAVVGVQPFGGWKMSGITGKHAGGHFYLPQFMREQSQTTYS